MSAAPGCESERTAANVGAGVARQTVEFLVVLCLCILVFRTFGAEAYIVPTGSMAPTLLGNHKELTCPNCGFRFALGHDDEDRAGRAACPNCGQSELDGALAVTCSGDRVLVQKFLYDFRRPNRWEVAVFHFPNDPTQAYVKRVVGLPGEQVQIVRGDIYIDGRIARKTLKEQRAMRVLVYDQNYPPKDGDRFPRWRAHRAHARTSAGSNWCTEGTRLVHHGRLAADNGLDWIDYCHWDPDRGKYWPVYDYNSYNGAELRGENRVDDLMLDARVALGPDVEAFLVRFHAGADRFVVELGTGGRAPLRVTRNGREILRSDLDPAQQKRLWSDRPARLEASVMDQRLAVAVDGALLFPPIDYEAAPFSPGPGERPIALGAIGGSVTVDDLRIYRDVYYTSVLAHTPRHAFGVESPYQLGPDEFFVLGDNSPVSNDSRFWTASPVVPASLLLGKPFLVHLPGQVVPLQVFGGSVYWVPDPREIRYIR